MVRGDTNHGSKIFFNEKNSARVVREDTGHGSGLNELNVSPFTIGQIIPSFKPSSCYQVFSSLSGKYFLQRH